MQKPDVLLYEKEAWASGFFRIAGVDEAGRGPLAGPVVAGAVVFAPGYLVTAVSGELAGLTDSKALSEKQRERLFELLVHCSAAEIGVGVVEADEIDGLNILKATHLAMARALEPLKPQYALVDGLPVKGLPCGSQAIVKGDALSISISAASIIAKVTRDRMMVALEEQYPGYGFARHKGYGTKAHLEAIRRLGPCAVHRKTFRPISEFNQLNLDL
jgi:ribonuclease HII